MTVAQYTELTGITVDSSDEAKFNAQIARTQSILESMLGYSLDPEIAAENQYDERGKLKTSDCIFNGVISDLDDVELDDPDEVVGNYRLFNYRKRDKYFAVDPYAKLHKVKLVFVQAGDEPNGITHKTFDNNKVRVHRSGSITKYIEKCNDCLCSCFIDCGNCVQVAVDADWLDVDNLPKDLLYVWTDMITYYCDGKKDIKSETLASHSYTKNALAHPEDLPESLKIIKKYAGPHGSVKPVVAV